MRVSSIRDVSAAVRGRRRDLGLSQAKLADRAGVSRKWVSEFEAGKPGVELGHVLAVLDELGLVMDIRGSSEDTPRVDLDAILEELRPDDPRAADG
jgi:HTH-type transcriptional regulator / antitoxin HipB